MWLWALSASGEIAGANEVKIFAFLPFADRGRNVYPKNLNDTASYVPCRLLSLSVTPISLTSEHNFRAEEVVRKLTFHSALT
jgi:hypothetical protein